MNANGVAGLFRAVLMILFVFLFVCFMTLRWGGTAADPLVVADNRRTPEDDLMTLESLQKTPLDQRDPSLLPLVRHVLVPPSSLPYHLDNEGEHSHGQAQLIKKLFKGKVS